MSRTAVIYRMMTPQHICPFGLKSKDLLERHGFTVEDHHLKSREEADAFKQQHDVKTTPQTFIDGKRVGGYDDLRRYLGLAPAQKEDTTYVPVIAIFLSTFLASAALTWYLDGTLASMRLLEWFVALSMLVLAIQKLQDLYSFSNQFITYDLLAMRVIRYAYVYPFAELYVALGMLAAFPAILVSPVALFIGCVGAASAFKAVYLDRRKLKCACVGGNSKVPLGFVSLTENLFMIAAAVWMWMR